MEMYPVTFVGGPFCGEVHGVRHVTAEIRRVETTGNWNDPVRAIHTYCLIDDREDSDGNLVYEYQGWRAM